MDTYCGRELVQDTQNGIGELSVSDDENKIKFTLQDHCLGLTMRPDTISRTRITGRV